MKNRLFLFIILGLFLISFASAQDLKEISPIDTSKIDISKIDISKDTLTYNEMQIKPYLTNTTELKNYTWEINETTGDFNPKLELSWYQWVLSVFGFKVAKLGVISEFHYVVNKLETTTCSPENQYSNICQTTKWNFDKFREKNNITNEKITLREDGLFDWAFYGWINDLDPTLEQIYNSASTLNWKNITDGTSSGAILDAPVLYMDFNKAPENLTSYYINHTNDYVQDNSIYNNKGDRGNLLDNGMWVNGNVSGGLEFDGVNDYVNLGTASQLSNLFANNATISMWINPSKNGTHRSLISSYEGNYNDGYVFRLGTGNRIDFRISYLQGYNSYTFPYIFSEGQYYHIVIINNNLTNKVTMYVNGGTFIDESTPNSTGTYNNSAGNNVNIGSWWGNSYLWGFNGLMDEVYVFNRTLNSTEINDLYTSNLVSNTTGLVSRWAFNETSGTTAYDYVGSNNGTLTGYSTRSPTYNASCTAFPGSGGCYEFDGVNDYIELNSLNNLSSYTNGWTLYAWVKYNDNAYTHGAIFGGAGLQVYTSNNKLDAHDGSYKYSTQAIRDGVWTQVAATCKDNILTFYINGTNDSSQSYICGYIDNYKVKSIGLYNIASFPFNGSIDEARIWDRALGSDEISDLYSDATSQGKYAKSGDFKSLVFYNSTSQYWNTTFYMANSTGQGVDLTDANLVSYWALDENYQDSKGTNHGTCTNCPLNTTGLSSDAMRFDGSDDCLSFGDINALDGLDNITVSVWVYSSNFDQSGMIVIKNPINLVWFLYAAETGNGVIMWRGSEPTLYLRIDAPMNNKWHHLLITQSGTNATIYVDGIYANTTTMGALGSSSGNVGVGCYGTSSYPFNGSIDEVLIYNDTLTQSEITNLYHTGLSQHASTNISLKTRTATTYNLTDTGLVSQWSFNTNQSGNATDDMGRNNGTCSGTTCPTWNEGNGSVGGGYYFDGGDYVNINGSVEDDPDLLTISLWAKWKAGSNDAVFGHRNSTTELIQIAITSSTTAIFQLRSSGNSLKTITYTGDTSKWHYYVGILDVASNSHKFYVDGVLVGTDTTNFGSKTFNSNKQTIGASNDGNYNFDFNGAIDEVRIYNRSLSASEVLDLYNIGTNYILWNDWTEESYMNDRVSNITSGSGKFYQFQALFNSNDSEISPYLLNHSVGFGGEPDLTAPYFITIPNNETITYLEDWNGVYFNATDETGFGYYSVNDTKFIINQTGYLDNLTSLSVGRYLINVSINDTSGNSMFTFYELNVTKNNGACLVYFNTTSPIYTLYTFLAFVDCASNYMFFRNGTEILNNSEQDLGVGIYNFSVNRSDYENYSNIFDDKWFEVRFPEWLNEDNFTGNKSCFAYNGDKGGKFAYNYLPTTQTNCSTI